MKNQFSITPIKNYSAPNLPTLAESKNNTAMLKKLPIRWTKKAAVVAYLAFAGTIALTSCRETHHGGAGWAPYYVQYPTEQAVPVTPEDLQLQLDAVELQYSTHWGGAITGPFYVVHITEQEVLGIIRTKLEIAGLKLGDTPPNDGINLGELGTFALDLFDEEKGVGISHITQAKYYRQWLTGGNRLVEKVTEEFAAKDGDITVGVFFSPREYIHENLRWWDWEDETYTPTAEGIAQIQAEAKATLVERLDEQVQAFVELLTGQGLLQCETVRKKGLK